MFQLNFEDLYSEDHLGEVGNVPNLIVHIDKMSIIIPALGGLL